MVPMVGPYFATHTLMNLIRVTIGPHSHPYEAL